MLTFAFSKTEEGISFPGRPVNDGLMNSSRILAAFLLSPVAWSVCNLLASWDWRLVRTAQRRGERAVEVLRHAIVPLVDFHLTNTDEKITQAQLPSSSQINKPKTEGFAVDRMKDILKRQNKTRDRKRLRVG